MENSTPILHNYFRSSSSWRVRIALDLKNIDYEYKPVSLIKDGGEQFLDEFTKINPKNEVPVLQIDNLSLTQSIPIIEYLNETRPNEFNLLLNDPKLRIKSRQIAEIINCSMQPYQNLNAIKRIASYAGDEKKLEWVQFYLNKGFNAIEKILEETSGTYCIGNNVSIADLCLVPQVYSAHRFKINMTKYPNVIRVNEELNKLAAFKKAHAHRQPDTLPELKEE